MDTSDAVTRAGLIKDDAIGLRKLTPDSLASLGEVNQWDIAVNQKLRMAKELLAQHPAFAGTLDDILWLPQKELLPASKQAEVLRRGPHVLGRIIAAVVRFLQDTGHPQTDAPAVNRDPKGVFVICGRDETLRRSVFTFLRAIGLNPKEWSELCALTGDPTPNILKVLNRGLASLQGVLVILSGDDLAHLRQVLWEKGESQEVQFSHFPTPVAQHRGVFRQFRPTRGSESELPLIQTP